MDGLVIDVEGMCCFLSCHSNRRLAYFKGFNVLVMAI